MGEVLKQVWMKSIKKLVSYLTSNQVNVQKESLQNTSGVHASSHKPTKKCANMKKCAKEIEKMCT